MILARQKNYYKNKIHRPTGIRFSMEMVWTENATFVGETIINNNVRLVLSSSEMGSNVLDFKRMQSSFPWLNVDDCNERKPGNATLRGSGDVNVGILFGQINICTTVIKQRFFSLSDCRTIC